MDVVKCGLSDKPDTPAPPPEKVASTLVEGGWAMHGYRMAFDGSAVVVPREDGFEVRKASQTWKHVIPNANFADRELFWSPDSKKFIFHLGSTIGIVDVDQQGDNQNATHRSLYTPPPTSVFRGMEWSPRGDEVLFLESFREKTENGRVTEVGDRIRAVNVSSGRVREIYRTKFSVNFFMPPVSRFENGSGPSTRDFKIIVGQVNGLFVISSDGHQTTCLSEAPAVGLTNDEWSPSAKEEKILLFFRTPTRNSKGMFKGTYLVHLDRRRANLPPSQVDDTIFEQLSPALDIHTLWFSPTGKYTTWANADAVYFREPNGPPESVTKLEFRDERDMLLDVKGCAWDAKEERLAVTARNRLYVYEVASKKKILVQTFDPIAAANFAAEPTWSGDQVVLTIFNDVGNRKHAGQGQK